jgi:hypothetical protein
LQDSEGNTYVYGLDLISATDGAGVQTYSLNDGLGSTSDLTDGSANPTDASFTVAPYQSITSGANCGVQGSFLAPTPWVVGIGPTGQFGAAPLEDKEGNIDFFSAGAEPFGEVGVSVGLPYGVGVSATCIRVLDVPFLSW